MYSSEMVEKISADQMLARGIVSYESPWQRFATMVFGFCVRTLLGLGFSKTAHKLVQKRTGFPFTANGEEIEGMFACMRERQRQEFLDRVSGKRPVTRDDFYADAPQADFVVKFGANQ